LTGNGWVLHSAILVETHEGVFLSQAAATPSSWEYPWYLENKGGLSMQVFAIYLDLYDGSNVIDSIDLVHNWGVRNPDSLPY
jgi:hypothetical protein